MSQATKFYLQLKRIAQQANHRQLLCIKGTEQWCIEQSITIINKEPLDFKWCGNCPSDIESTNHAALLGQDVNLLILNMHPTFNANMFAAAEGSVRGGCIIVLLLPDSISNTDHFSRYVQQQLKHHQFPVLTEAQQITTIENIEPVTLVKPSLNLNGQQKAIEQTIRTVTGHRRRPLVITANRGRGKSSALGIAAARLVNDGLSKILVCAPNKQSVTTLYKHATLTLNNKEHIHQIQFIAPDALALELPQCDLLIIDEAAAIPIKLLALYTKQYSRLVFATTQFGYEGSGRGFALRFQQQLNDIAPEWRPLRLTQPIRWADDDPVEEFTLSTLCLIDQTEKFNVNLDTANPDIQVITHHDLLQQPLLLNQIFSLLINAHYQTKPSDLTALLNDQDLTIVAIKSGEQILAVAVINDEGNFDKDTSEQIYQGKRRPNGHLIAQSFTFHSGFKQAATHRYARVQRIAVQPSLQKQGLGSRLLNWIISWAKEQQFDHISASFGGTASLLQFWLAHDLNVLRIGTRKDKSSGEHSLMMNLPLSLEGKKLHQQMQTDFTKQAKIQLSRQLSHLDPSLVVALWPQIASNRPIASMKQSLSAYINGHRGYENIEYLLIDLITTSSLDTLSSKQQYCLIEKVIQNHSWQEITLQHGFTGQKQAQAFLKSCICDLLTNTILTKQREQ